MSITCGVCGFQFDPGDLDAVLFHETHFHQPDIQYSGSKKIETIESLQSQLAAEKEARVKAEFMLERCRDSAKALFPEIDSLKISKQLAEARVKELEAALSQIASDKTEFCYHSDFAKQLLAVKGLK